ncbi:hypothetical protein J2X16_000446 [Pelomonas aquatica]|uniref:Uncharacterized protein n=1 Tax=Pelomonas aquatica TaxID=431058 RepID=A0ABU1Z525_9BURK|nr:hypothetical protein [Pelomonas aquatica]MDR7295125.1 hypothetical protein [Pelomonas aquatica]
MTRPPSGVGLLMLLSGAIWAGAASGAEELPRSAACRTALQALERAEDAIADTAAAASAPRADAERRRAVAARLQPLRQRVADACLGGLTTSPPPSQRTWIAPAPSQAQAQSPRMRAPAPIPEPLPLPRVEAPITISNCNAATCLGSDGSTLTRVGPNLVGPRGACTVQGVFLRCP